MASFGKKLTLAIGVVAGAALAAFAVSKSGQKEMKRLGSKSVDLKNDLLANIGTDLTRIKRLKKRFI